MNPNITVMCIYLIYQIPYIGVLHVCKQWGLDQGLNLNDKYQQSQEFVYVEQYMYNIDINKYLNYILGYSLCVSTNPGQTALHVTPYSADSRAMTCKRVMNLHNDILEVIELTSILENWLKTVSAIHLIYL